MSVGTRENYGRVWAHRNSTGTQDSIQHELYVYGPICGGGTRSPDDAGRLDLLFGCWKF
jgi:hypothetical protein